jgi:signal transduction histidine kinase
VKLADFILGNMEPILVEWESFAATRTPAASTMTPLALRDHAEEILLAITRDLASAQTPLQQHQKSLGNGLAEKSHAAETAAQTHATLRSRSGFDINQLAAEYRALRASVLRQWLEASAGAHCDLDDMVRFNEAIDQALAESIAFFSAEVDRARNLLLGMLGHDMRTPLQTIIATAAYLAELNAGAQVSDASCRLITSGARMKALLDDLVDFNRTNLGLGIPVAMEPGDLAAAFSAELDLLRGAHPRRRIDLTIEGDAHGCWDTLRMRQLLCNLVTNAIKYGDSDAPVQVHLIGEASGLRFEVRNRGVLEAAVDALFEPLRRGVVQRSPGDPQSLGLGLYIAREIAKAHGGDIECRPGNTETIFSVRLPRAGIGADSRETSPA